MLIELCLGITVLLGLFYYQFSKNKNYWYDRHIPNTGFKFFYGDDGFFIKQNEAGMDWGLRAYKQFEGVPFFGGWTLLGQPYLMIRNDFDLIKSIKLASESSHSMFFMYNLCVVGFLNSMIST